MLVALNKPFGYLSQFTEEINSKWRPLADLNLPKNIYPIGRLDADSEGLLLLSDEAHLTRKILPPDQKQPKVYWAQVEGNPSRLSLEKLQKGVVIQKYQTLPCRAKHINPPTLWDREPPIRYRRSIPDSWLEIELKEGKNRQVRRMTASIGYPTLRLIRMRVGGFTLPELAPGEWAPLSNEDRKRLLP